MANKPVESSSWLAMLGKYKLIFTGNYLVRSFMAGLFIAVGGALATVCGTARELHGSGIQSMIGARFPVALIALVSRACRSFNGDTMLIPMAGFRTSRPGER
jgi:formate/nitrite transporter FocA (FNT family)